MKKPKLNKVYLYPDLENYAKKKLYDIEEHGNDIIGEAFLVMRSIPHPTNVISFVMVAANGKGMPFYKCIYSDI